MIVIELVPSQQISSSITDQLIDIYRKAFSIAPYYKSESEVQDFAKSLPDHMQREGFRLVIGRDTCTNKLIGFAYGYTTVAGQWWHDKVVERVEILMAEEWFDSSFQLVEIAVNPEAQGKGIGGHIHDNLLKNLPQKKAVLSTLQAETAAYQMYNSRGWEILVGNFKFPGRERVYQIMGLDLTKARIEDAG